MSLPILPRPADNSTAQSLCLTICGYRRPGMSEVDYRQHMTQVSAPMTADLMVKYGVKRWTMIHNTTESRALMDQLIDPQMANIADFDCFSQVVLHDLAGYKRLKEDSWYREHLVGDHEKFADTRRSMMTIGWVTEIVRDGQVVKHSTIPHPMVAPALRMRRRSSFDPHVAAVMTGSILTGAMLSLSFIAVPVLLDTTTHPPQLLHQWSRLHHYGHVVLPSTTILTGLLYIYAAVCYHQRSSRRWGALALAGVLTVAIAPFTWLVMAPTTHELFRLQAVTGQMELVGMAIGRAQALVSHWRNLHMVRSLFPLLGAIIGAVALVGS
ncbi:uncharacterized protein BO72DRAFT_426094 [Aspergillus fijiensis CBS 313.89]|uniref:EthD domain-containing protein n=1 Tax=Aspergillus fijiensis CBS 313.89 TaxID=1448319 RepID=A0A8G1RUA9_9EURO|nr:uncharacterized protein BO72DRAFT_426094 [Aspergillus fijiensis CBS 313.89]RAK79033.1 hypothetical protein BO72DRAFT_426094 [Aspergillus fijiensis CBS 313.89]